VGAVRLKLRVDADSIANEIRHLKGGPRNRTQANVDATLLRCFGNQRIHQARSNYTDTEVLHQLPLLREAIHETIPAEPCTAMVANLKPKGVVTVHSDAWRYFSSTFRIHMPVVTNPQVRTWCFGKAYEMKAGEVWALNNMALHAVVNESQTESRAHIICDYVPNDELIELITNGETQLGYEDPDLHERVFRETGKRFSADVRRKYERWLKRDIGKR
jgi:hypothetical protein